MPLIPENCHPFWSDFLDPIVIAMLDRIESEIGEDVNPEKQHILRFLANDLNKITVVILGQDPYPEHSAATGRAFEVGTLESWQQPFRQVSLKNIIRLIYKSYNNIENYNDIPPFSRISRDIAAGGFRLEEPQKLFKSWENQGVLLLNIWLSCGVSCPGAHRQIWQPFSIRLLNYISLKKPDIHWFLWGKNAISYKSCIVSGNLHESRHPMMCSELYEDDFLKTDCIEKTMSLINWMGK